MRVLATYFALEFVSLCVWVGACVRAWMVAGVVEILDTPRGSRCWEKVIEEVNQLT